MSMELPGVINGVSTDAKIQRRLTQILAGGAVGSFAGGASATNGAAHGVCGYNHFKVTESDTPAMSVDVAAGLGLATGTVSAEQGPYGLYNDATETLTVAAADATNPRKDLVIAQPRDSTYDGDDDDGFLTVVTGTPAASPSDPALTDYPNAVVLARIDVDANATSIVDADITDLRVPAGDWARPWGILPGGYDVVTTGQTSIGTGGATITGLSIAPTFVEGRMYRIKALLHVDIVATATYATAALAFDGSTIQANGAELTAGPYTELNVEFVGPAPSTGSKTVTAAVTAGPSGTVQTIASSSVPIILYAEDIGPAPFA